MFLKRITGSEGVIGKFIAWDFQEMASYALVQLQNGQFAEWNIGDIEEINVVDLSKKNNKLEIS